MATNYHAYTQTSRKALQIPLSYIISHTGRQCVPYHTAIYAGNLQQQPIYATQAIMWHNQWTVLVAACARLQTPHSNPTPPTYNRPQSLLWCQHQLWPGDHHWGQMACMEAAQKLEIQWMEHQVGREHSLQVPNPHPTYNRSIQCITRGLLWQPGSCQWLEKGLEPQHSHQCHIQENPLHPGIPFPSGLCKIHP